MEQASIGASPDFVDDIGLKIAVDCAWDIFALAWGEKNASAESVKHCGNWVDIPVSEKKVLKPWSGSAALRSSVK